MRFEGSASLGLLPSADVRVAVLYESLTGNTERAGTMVAEAAAAAGADVSLASVVRPDLTALAAADLVIIGTWVDGLVVAGHRPGGAAHLHRMPVIDRKPVALYMTYALHAGRALDKFGALVAGRGGDVLGGRLLRRDRLAAGVDDFVLGALDRVTADR